MTRGSAGSEYRRRCCDRTRVGRAGCRGVGLKRTCAFALGFGMVSFLERQSRGQTRLAPVIFKIKISRVDITGASCVTEPVLGEVYPLLYRGKRETAFR